VDKVYIDDDGCRVFLSQWIGYTGWFTVRLKPGESEPQRIISAKLLTRKTKEQAQADLDAYAEEKNWRMNE